MFAIEDKEDIDVKFYTDTINRNNVRYKIYRRKLRSQYVLHQTKSRVTKIYRKLI